MQSPSQVKTPKTLLGVQENIFCVLINVFYTIDFVVLICSMNCIRLLCSSIHSRLEQRTEGSLVDFSEFYFCCFE